MQDESLKYTLGQMMSVTEHRMYKTASAAFICLLISLCGFLLTTFFAEVNLAEPKLQPVASKILKFVDQSDGNLNVIDATNNEVVDVVYGDRGFIQDIVRKIAAERLSRGLDISAPVELSSYMDGRVILADPISKLTIHLESFGKMNAEAFGAFLTKPKSRS